MIFVAIAGKFHFKFKDRVTAAGILAESLKDKVSTEERKRPIVLAIPRGGAVTGDMSQEDCLSDFIILPSDISKVWIMIGAFPSS